MQIEYDKIIPNHGIMSVEELNKMGADGWDNYAIEKGVFYFKRISVNKIDPRAERLVSNPFLMSDTMRAGADKKNKK